MLDQALQRFWPARCAACAGPALGRDLCAACAAEVQHNDPACPCCAEPLLVPALACGHCLRRAPSYAAAWAPFRYAAPLDLLVQQLKFGANLAAGRVLGQLWVEALVERTPPSGATLLPVPLARSRLAERGYNQALELARPLARRLDLCLHTHGLRRIRATDPQSGLDRRARQRNVNGAFAADPSLRGQEVIVIDDVMTTGATLAACARALKRVGVARIEVWALARAGR
jgi:ComF family protein